MTEDMFGPAPAIAAGKPLTGAPGVRMVGRGQGPGRELLAVTGDETFLGITVRHCGHPTALRPWYIDTYPQWAGPQPASRAHQNQADALLELAAIILAWQQGKPTYWHVPTGPSATNADRDCEWSPGMLEEEQ